MTLFQYLDERYRSLNLELQVEYTVSKEAELKASYALIQYQRNTLKILKMPAILLRYFLIHLGWMKKPEPFEMPKTEVPKVKEEIQNSAIQ